MAQYKKRKDGRYATRVSTGKYDKDGKAIVLNLSARTQAELRARVSAAKADLSRGVYAVDYGKTFGEYADAWLKLEKSELSLKGRRKYANAVNTYLAPIRGIRLKELERQDILACINAQAGHPDNQRMARLTAKAVLDAAIEDGLIYRNPAAKIHLKAHRPAEKRPLTGYEREAVERVEWEPIELAMITLLRYFGLRFGEIAGLMKNDIDFRKDCVHVRRAVTYGRGETIIKDTKSAAGRRSVDAPEGILRRLKPFVDNLPGVYLFADSGGVLMTQWAFRNVWNRIYDKIDAYSGGREKLEAIKLTPHVFRHSYATDLYYAGIDVKDAQRLLGHSSVSVTLGIYTHLTVKSDTKNRLKKIVL